MDMRQLCEHLGIIASEEQLTAGRYLESRGRKFCVHFGVDNAVAFGDEMFNTECDELQQMRVA